ncbi:MAG: SDR family NAD(P)-dependent oxidoreductase [Chloroflexota bacterium]|nr:SDR family NAD(P)-dependent oxidoreductase [Chloroflexota bacterium]
MGDKLKGKVAIVTGAGRGIGRSEAIFLADEGAKVVVNNDIRSAPDGSTTSPADAVVKEIRDRGGEAIANYDTVATTEGGETIIQSAIGTFGRLDILVNNAGFVRDRMIFNMTPEEWDDVIKVHLYGHFNCTKPACVIFRQQQSGRIINTSSESGLGNMGQANYSAAKEGIIGFTRTVARDMARYGVTCNAIRPRAATRMTTSPELQADMERTRSGDSSPNSETGKAISRLDPDAIAPFVAYLATDEAAYINGCTFQVMEGQISLYSEPKQLKTIHTDGIWTLDELSLLVPVELAPDW